MWNYVGIATMSFANTSNHPTEGELVAFFYPKALETILPGAKNSTVPQLK